MACLTLGFEIVARNSYLALVPILLDVFLWLGPRLSLASLMEPLRDFWAIAPTPEAAPVYQAMRQIVGEIAEKFNLFAFLEPVPLMSVPTLMGYQLTLERPFGVRPSIEIPSGLAALGWWVLLLVAAMGLSALYLTQIGRRAQEELEGEVPRPGPGALWRTWWGLLQLLVVLLLAFLIISIPLFTVITLAGAASTLLSALVMMVFISLLLYFGYHCLYIVPGMVQLHRSPWQALKESFLLTRVDFVGTAGFVLVMLVIQYGLNIIWSLPSPDSWAMLVGILGHGIISAALTAALFVFYQERLTYLKLLQQAFATKLAQSFPER